MTAWHVIVAGNSHVRMIVAWIRKNGMLTKVHMSEWSTNIFGLSFESGYGRRGVIRANLSPILSRCAKRLGKKKSPFNNMTILNRAMCTLGDARTQVIEEVLI